MRWALKLQSYEFSIEHRRGHANGNADGLSRQFLTHDKERYGFSPKKVGGMLGCGQPSPTP